MKKVLCSTTGIIVGAIASALSLGGLICWACGTTPVDANLDIDTNYPLYWTVEGNQVGDDYVYAYNDININIDNSGGGLSVTMELGDVSDASVSLDGGTFYRIYGQTKQFYPVSSGSHELCIETYQDADYENPNICVSVRDTQYTRDRRYFGWVITHDSSK